MQKIMITIFILFSHLCFSQENSLTVVAVGEAEQEKELISFVEPKLAGFSVNNKKLMKESFKILKEDFDFYRHIFTVDKKTYSKINQVKSAHYVVSTRTSIVDKVSWLEIKVQNMKTKEELLKVRKKILFNNIRSFSHAVSNQIYKSIKGRDSIFESKIAFVSDRTSKGKEIRKELYVMDFDGARRQRLTFNNSIIISPAISPSGTHAVFTLVDNVYKKRATGGVAKIKNLNLYQMNLRTRKMERISNSEGINSGAIYNQSGDSIYLTLSYGKNADIYKMNLATKALKRITNHFAADVDPHINGSEGLMTFLSGRPGKAMIYTLDPSGTEKKVKRISFVGDFNAAPRFNPSGSEIVFSSWVDQRFDIYRIDSNGTNLVRLTKNFGSNEEPWYSPDGEFIVFSSQRVISRKKAVQDLYIMNRDGEIIKKITTNYGKVFTPRWSK